MEGFYASPILINNRDPEGSTQDISTIPKFVTVMMAPLGYTKLKFPKVVINQQSSAKNVEILNIDELQFFFLRFYEYILKNFIG